MENLISKWSACSEPTEYLLNKVNLYLQILGHEHRVESLGELAKSSSMPIEIRGKRRLELIRSLLHFLKDNKVTVDFLHYYVYSVDVYRDAYDLVFDYMGECEHGGMIQGTPKDILDEFIGSYEF